MEHYVESVKSNYKCKKMNNCKSKLQHYKYLIASKIVLIRNNLGNQIFIIKTYGRNVIIIHNKTDNKECVI